MIKIKVECIEPDTMPLRQSIDVHLLQRFRLFLLNDVRFSSASKIRSAMLMKADSAPPPEASLVMELDIYDPGAGDPLVFRVKKMGSRVYTDLVRPNVRSRLAEGHEIPSGSRLEMMTHDTRRIMVTLQLESDLIRSADVMGAGAIRHKETQGSSAGWFLYNSVMQLLALNYTQIRAKVILTLRKWGIHPTIFLTLGSIGLLLGTFGWLAWNRHKAAEDATEKAEKAEEKSQRTEEARANALSNEMACLQEQQRMAAKLGLIEEQRTTAVKEAVNFSFTQGIAVENGLKLTEITTPFDEQQKETAIKSIVSKMEFVTADTAGMEKCVEQKQALGVDLPHFILTWHPERKYVCPDNYQKIDGAVEQLGHWGISGRVAAEYGAKNMAEGGESGNKQIEEELGDIRRSLRWGASTVALSVRDVQKTLFSIDLGDRQSTTPSVSHLWSLAMVDAYNRMPSPSDGIMNKTIAYCVNQVVETLAKNEKSPVPGSPVLPDIAAVAAGDAPISIQPTPGCPWPNDAFKKGANAALQAAANFTVYYEKTKDTSGQEKDEG